MIWLLDVNALIAVLVAAHEHHDRVASWLATLPAADSLATCSITELGFVRVLNQTPHLRVPVKDSMRLLERFRGNRARPVVQFPDDRSATNLLRWAKSARHVTDAHLAGLAERHGGRLATLDAGSPENPRSMAKVGWRRESMRLRRRNPRPAPSASGTF